MDEEITLVYKVPGGSGAFKVPEEIKVEVFAEEQSITRSEFYQANQAGIDTKFVLVVWHEDYRMTAHKVNDKTEYASKVLYNEEEYEIVRAYRKKNSEKIELVCK